MQEYLEKRRELEEVEYEKYEEEYERLILDTSRLYKDGLKNLLDDIKQKIYERESENGFDLEINEKELLNLIVDEI